MDIQTFIGLHPDDPSLVQYLSSVSNSASRDATPVPEIKSYSDAVYFNYFALGLSLQFAPKDGYKPKSRANVNDLKLTNLVLDSIYIYNVPKPSDTRIRAAELAYSTYPVASISLTITYSVKDKDGKEISRPPKLNVGLDTTGKDFVHALGEPDRKGGGAGPSSGSIGIWCEWSKDGIMVEFGGDDAKGPQAWERGKDAKWKIITLFSPAQ